MKKPVVIAFLFSAFFLLSSLFLPQLANGAEAEQSTKLDKKYADYAQFIVIDKSKNRLYYYEKGKLIKSFAVATGAKPSYTPEGLFKIREKIKNRPYYKENIKGGDPKNPLGDRWLGLEVKLKDGTTSYAYGIHGNNNESSIGKYVSAGCIRMHNKSIRAFYDEIEVGTKVLIRK
ncbi:L,D-transpeptidase [Cohnella lubricantis]|uniref:L,D-transpeptidase n=1 Tax=Cohnella lubricantis TaxID=2163172 RepID=A0A841TC64_9BACL|nr:L,D-transpeptidase [Cohnella lubricantis]MBB6678602.1 L,D-transpeptidase [Cohnella lubricantis]MBP2119240.1 lipoprotein-anchoring transpeptidase ErfK/SrfK [Cohnella lubricantis]